MSTSTASASARPGQVPSVEVFVARQPIFNRFEQAFGYELLFRSSLSNFFQHPDSDQASLKVIADTLFLFGVEAITRGKHAFVNFTRETLVNGYAALLPKDVLVIEVPADLEPDDEVLAALKSLKQQGYTIALDECYIENLWSPVVELADIVKVDFRATEPEERARLFEALEPRGIDLLAYRIESQEHFGEAMSAGYTYFQGYFFCKPVVVSTRDVPASELNYLRLLQEINRPELSFDEIEGIIKREVSLSYKLLRYINSVYFGLRHKLSSVRQALLMLGARGIKNWASVIILSDMGLEKPAELVVVSVLRARLCEVLAARVRLKDRESDLFLMGLFSLMDVMVGRPLPDIVRDLPIADDVKAVLAGEENALKPVYDLVLAYEQGDWEEVGRLTKQLRINEAELPELYRNALEWTSHATELAA